MRVAQHSELYRTYLQSEAWRCIRQQVLDRDSYRCQDCGAGRRLHVHHLTYRYLGQEPHYDLLTLCEGCHEQRHFEWCEFNGEGWDPLGGETAWRREHNPGLGDLDGNHLLKWGPRSDLEESYLMETLYGLGEAKENYVSFCHTCDSVDD